LRDFAQPLQIIEWQHLQTCNELLLPNPLLLNVRDHPIASLDAK
jgi:hypothetical protein